MTYRRLVGFGEAMLRMTVREGIALETATTFEASVGGAELNACIAAQRAGMPAAWVSALPEGSLGRHVQRHVRANGVDAVVVTRPDSRLGLYFLAMAPPPHSLRMTYDRASSAFALLEPDSLDWTRVLTPDACLLVSGISPPLGDGPRRAVEDAVATAGEVGATVALDVNYRAALWSREEASAWLASVLPRVDVLSAGADDLVALGAESRDPLADAVERFLAGLPEGDLEFATEQALRAAVTCVGLFGDALVGDLWDATETRGVVR